MFKTNIGTKEKLIFALACFIALSVFMLSVHAKDLLHYRDLTVASRVEYHDISAKATSELHDHVDKQVVKTFDNNSGENFVMSSRNREDLDILNEEDPGLWGRLHEALLFLNLYASISLSF